MIGKLCNSQEKDLEYTSERLIKLVEQLQEEKPRISQKFISNRIKQFLKPLLNQPMNKWNTRLVEFWLKHFTKFWTDDIARIIKSEFNGADLASLETSIRRLRKIGLPYSKSRCLQNKVRA